MDLSHLEGLGAVALHDPGFDVRHLPVQSSNEVLLFVGKRGEAFVVEVGPVASAQMPRVHDEQHRHLIWRFVPVLVGKCQGFTLLA